MILMREKMHILHTYLGNEYCNAPCNENCVETLKTPHGLLILVSLSSRYVVSSGHVYLSSAYRRLLNISMVPLTSLPKCVKHCCLLQMDTLRLHLVHMSEVPVLLSSISLKTSYSIFV